MIVLLRVFIALLLITLCAPVLSQPESANKTPVPAALSVDSQQAAAPVRAATAVSTSRIAAQVISGLLFVTLLIFALAWLAKKMGYANMHAKGGMKVLASLPLGNRERAVLLDVQGQQILLGVAPGRVSFLQNIEAQANIEAQQEEFVTASTHLQKGQEFGRYLKNILSQGSSRT